jgi:hypothetical protein
VRADAARRRFAKDPTGAISALEELREKFAPSPSVLHALCLLYSAAGDDPKARVVGEEALRLAFARGNVQLAADVVEALLAHVSELGLTKEQLFSSAEALRRAARARSAATLYELVLTADAGEGRAVKGMLQCAEMLEREGDPRSAVRVYDFLLARCPSSPLADFARQARAEAARKAE